MEFRMNVMPLEVTPTQMHELLSWQGDSWQLIQPSDDDHFWPKHVKAKFCY
jgi:hypothetical protein